MTRKITIEGYKLAKDGRRLVPCLKHLPVTRLPCVWFLADQRLGSDRGSRLPPGTLMAGWRLFGMRLAAK